MTIQPRFATLCPPGRPITIRPGTAAVELAADDDEDADDLVKGSGPPPPTAWASPSGTDLGANGSAPFPPPCLDTRFVVDAAGAAGTAAEALPLERFSRCGTSHASSAASTAASTTTRIFWRRCFAAIRALFADPRRLIAAAEAI
jgi:hypothetical protein